MQNKMKVQLLDHRGRPFASDTAYFGASREAREFKAWNPSLESADATLANGEASTLAARAYDLERNNGIAAGYVRTKVDNVVGTGFRLSARPDYKALGKTKEWADAWSRITEAEWRSFANSKDFDAARQQNFNAMTVVAFREAILCGDAIALPLWITDNRPGAKWKTCFQAVDAARLANPPGKMASNSVREGIELNGYGEPVMYHFRNSHPGDLNFAANDSQFESVPARTEFGRRRVVHLFEKQRPDQTRGRSMLASVMGAFRMLDHYQRVELQAVVINSLIAAFIETPMDGEDIADLFGDTQKYMESRKGWDVKMDGAGVVPLHPGDKMSAFVPGRPNTAYSAFVEAVMRNIGTGLNLPYELLMKDFSKTNYSSARAALLEAWRYFSAMREWLVSNWADPIYELFFEEAVNAGKIEAPTFYEERLAWLACKWVGPGRGFIDPLKEAQAVTERMKNGVSTLEDECAEQGKDWEVVLEQRARENAYALELGLPPVHLPPPQGGAPGMESPAAPAAPDEKTGDDAANNQDEPT